MQKRFFPLLAILGAAGCHASARQGSNVDQGVRLDGGGGDQGSTGDAGTLTISPLNQTVTVTVGQAIVPLAYTATLGGAAVPAAWVIDRGEIGAIDQNGSFTPSGNLGGVASITAIYGGQQASTNVTVQLNFVQSGDPNYGSSTPPGLGGYGGVGGNGPGGPASTTQQTTLASTPTLDTKVTLLYPYDKTLWPRGLLAPLLQWDSNTHTFDSISIHLHETAFDYQGTFSAPAGGKPFVNLPIPQQAWDMLGYSNSGELVQVTLVFGEGANAVGPYLSSWRVAQATLKGTVYYNSYGTHLLSNQSDGFGGSTYGAATLSIKPGATAPGLVTANAATCRVCHTVAPDGKSLYTEHGDSYPTTSRFDLLAGNAETTLPSTGLTFAAISPDGTLAFSSAGGPKQSGIELGDFTDSTSRLYNLPAGTLAAPVNLPAGLQGATPGFSPDGTKIAFNFYAGTGSDKKSLAMIGFTPSTLTFGTPAILTTPAGGLPAVWPSFLPDSKAIVYEVETTSTAEFAYTRDGIRGELWYYDLASSTATRLDNLNGKPYVPTGAANHTDDTTLNYEPTLNPIVSGGYAWVVFTSRRLYGNVGTMDPWSSDPRNFDLVNNVTTKKLWVAAIDLNAPASIDPSHPAFYLPAQELNAGNSRGFWAVDACHADGAGCVTGDECCGGYCEPSGDGGLVCSSQKPTCGMLFDKCTQDSDCCGSGSGVKCINQFCSSLIP